MKVQSLSIVVPNKECMNKCPFCVARMVNSNIYENKMSINDPHYDINVRICCNLTSEFNQGDIPYDEDFYGYLKEAYHADQVTFRKMYASDKDTPQGKWLAAHEFPKKEADGLSSSLKWFPVISKTPYGANIRDVQGMSVIYDEDCMGKNPDSDVKKFLILRPNCKLYSQWDTKASLVM